jgi:hypothetical protein
VSFEELGVRHHRTFRHILVPRYRAERLLAFASAT